MIRSLVHVVIHTFFRDVVIEGRESLPVSGPVIFTPNHPNALLDPMLMFFLSPPFRLRFVAKASLFKIPVFGGILRSLGAIPVERRLEADGEVDYTVFFASCVDALAKGDSIVIFPEGRSLPQPSLAPLRTGPARLYFLARDKGVEAMIIPIGLNYERGYIFRSAVLISIAPAADTHRYTVECEKNSVEAVRGLTAEIAESLKHHVVQAETYRDRELMLLLEKLAAGEDQNDSWRNRFIRLKQFEKGLARLRLSCPAEIDRLRRLLERYERLSSTFGVDGTAKRDPAEAGFWKLLPGLIFAGIGTLFNWLPYRLCALLVRLTRRDESEAATFKVIYSLFLFPLAFFLEGAAIAHWLGWIAAVFFAVAIVPLSYFTLHFLEKLEETEWLFGSASRRVANQLERLRRRILAELETLAARPELM